MEAGFKYRSPQYKACASQPYSLSRTCVPLPPGNGMSRSERLRYFQDRSRHSHPCGKPSKILSPGCSGSTPHPGWLAYQHPHLQTRFWVECSLPVKRALYTLLKSQALFKTSAWDCVALIEMKNKLSCQATVERGQEKRTSDKQLVSTSQQMVIIRAQWKNNPTSKVTEVLAKSYFTFQYVKYKIGFFFLSNDTDL